MRLVTVSIALLAVTLALWLTAFLFRFGIVNIFDAYLMKFPGPAVVFGAMAFGPLLVALLGVRMMRSKSSPVVGRFSVVAGLLLFVLFVVLIGVPMFSEALAEKTPPNPQTPRPVDDPVGLPVFPGAQGFGTRTPAGRGGKVIEVTSLADNGPGTLREALNDTDPRIIVFRVGGTIELEDFLVINHPFVTIAGQTAPGEGICIRNAGVVVFTNDVLIQHMRIRPGMGGDIRPDHNDAIAILGKHGDQSGAHHVVIDHVSVSWGEDETVSTWFGAHDVTISYCIISEALNRGRHQKGTHSAGLLIGDGSYHVTVHHCLLAHNDFRNPLMSAGGTHDIVNNVIYNWGVLPAEIVDPESNTFLNFIGNYFLPGPSSRTDCYEILINPSRKYGVARPRIYVEGNLGPHRTVATLDEWAVVGYGFDETPAPLEFRALEKFETHSVDAAGAQEAYGGVLAHAGAILPKRDAVDSRIVHDVKNKTGSIIDSPDEVGGYPQLSSGVAPVDSDHDGMPDDWENQRELDPNDASDRNGDLDNDGYTNVEEYLHSLLLPVTVTPEVTPPSS
jgi:pectate lyase